MTVQIGRREFLTALGGTAAAWPLAAHAQQPAMPVIGLLEAQSSAASARYQRALRQGLADAGFIEGRNLSIVIRSADGNIARLPRLAVELVQIPVTVILAVSGDQAVHAAKAATTTIPIVFTTASDPVETGIVASLNRPGGNVTGATFLGSLAAAKQIGLLHDMVPKLATIGLLTSPLVPMTLAIAQDVQTAAQAIGLRAVVVNLDNEDALDAAFAQFVQQRVDALVVSSGAVFNRLRERIIALAAQHSIPTIFGQRFFAEAGGLMSYGGIIEDAYRQAGLYIGRILRGEKPSDLPVIQPTRFELVINMKTVKALGLTVPAGLLGIADEVIE